MKHLLALLALVLAAACAPQPGVGSATVLTYGTLYPPAHPFSRADLVWIAWVEKESGGRLKIHPYWSGGLISSDESMSELRHGLVDIGLITPIYARGGAQVIRVQSGFYGGARNYADQLAVYHCMVDAFPEFARETEGLKILAVQGGNLPGVVTRDRQVRTLEDFRGLRLRAPQELTGLLADLGADPVSMAMQDVYSALAKGVIDGVVAPGDTLSSLHFTEVSKHFTTVRFARGAYPSRAISLKTWARLSPDIQDVLERSIPVWEKAMETEVTKAQDVGLAFGKKNGTDFVDFDPDSQARLDALYNKEALIAARKVRLGETTAEPIFNLAQAAIANLRAGSTQPCPSGGAS